MCFLPSIAELQSIVLEVLEMHLFSREKMFNVIIVRTMARAYFKLLISFICQEVKVVCVGCSLKFSVWANEKKCSGAEKNRSSGVGGIMVLQGFEIVHY